MCLEKDESILCSFTKSLLYTVSMYPFFDISLSLSPSISLSLSMPFISQRSLISAYFNIATALPPFVTLSLLLISVIFTNYLSLSPSFLIWTCLFSWSSVTLLFYHSLCSTVFISLDFFYPTCCDLTISSPLSLSLSLSLSFSLSLFLLIPLPHSLPMYLSQTTTISLSINISLLLSVSLLFCYWISISHSLTYFQSLWRNLWL